MAAHLSTCFHPPFQLSAAQWLRLHHRMQAGVRTALGPSFQTLGMHFPTVSHPFLKMEHRCACYPSSVKQMRAKSSKRWAICKEPEESSDCHACQDTNQLQVFFFLLVGLEFELRSLYWQNRWSTAWAHLQPILVMGSHELFAEAVLKLWSSQSQPLK
jgi:hypothetical protein